MGPSRNEHWISSAVRLAAAVAALLTTTQAEAEESCPARAAVVAHLPDEATRNADFHVDDEGESFSVSFGGERRAFVDSARDCASRAKLAAVAVTSLVAPPSARLAPDGARSPEAPPGAAPSSPPSPSPAAPSRPSPLRWVAFLATDVSPATSDHGTVVAFGVAARGAWFPGRIGVAVGLAMFAPARFDVGPKEVRLVRAVTDLSLHYAAPLGKSIRLIPGLGPALEIHDVRGTAANGAGELRALFAVRASLEVALVLSRTLSLAVETSALALPATGDLALHEGGVVGKEPWFYVGLGIGLRVQP